MNRMRALAAMIGVTLWVLSAAPAHAQTVDTTPSTDPVTVPDTTPTTDPGTNGDAPPESVPQVDGTIPDRPVTDPAAPAPPARATVVRIDLRAARAQALARQAAYDAAVAHRQDLESALAALQARVGQLRLQEQAAIRDLTAAHDDLVQRAIDAYVRGPDVEVLAGPDTQIAQRTALLSAVAARDRQSVDRYEAARRQVTKEQAKTAQDIVDTRAQLDQARADEAAAQLDLTNAKLDLAVTTAGGNLVIHGFVFPVASPHSFTEDFGDPRLPGTPDAHTHQGCDVVAAEGTELYAAERGAITQLSAGGLGGTGLWIKGESGTYYYYAHLSAYADGLHPGQIVEAGDLVGYVGHTGDAYGPHLHFEVHPGGGAAVDPYPILLAADTGGSARP